MSRDWWTFPQPSHHVLAPERTPAQRWDTDITWCSETGKTSVHACPRTHSALKPLTCRILICFTMVLFPDSPAPSREIESYIWFRTSDLMTREETNANTFQHLNTRLGFTLNTSHMRWFSIHWKCHTLLSFLDLDRPEEMTKVHVHGSNEIYRAARTKTIISFNVNAVWMDVIYPLHPPSKWV